MGFYHYQGSQNVVNAEPEFLLKGGFNMPVEITTASIIAEVQKQPMETAIVMAHFDTGASITSIDINLAKCLKLMATGTQKSLTAAGSHIMPTYIVNIAFPNTTLSPFFNLRINSCKLPFNPKLNLDPRNFGLLLGRDVMAHWNIVWNGMTSTVFVND